MKRLSVCVFFSILSIALVRGQHFALKNNMLYDVTTTLNWGFEVGLAPKWTWELTGNYNPFEFNANKKLKHWLVQPEFRYWTCERFYGHFFGVHAHYGEYNAGGIKLLGLKNYRYQGNLYGAGVSYGYHLILNKRWSLEGIIGLGYARLNYDKYRCEKCGEKLGSYKTNYVGPTKAALNLIYIIN